MKPIQDLTNAELNAEIAERCGVGDRYVIMKRGMYYRPNAHGYTYNLSEAWIVDLELAQKHERPRCDEPVTIQKVGPPNYAEDLNASRVEILKLGGMLDEWYTHKLLCLTVWNGKYREDNKHKAESDIRWGIASASARQCAEALLDARRVWGT